MIRITDMSARYVFHTRGRGVSCVAFLMCLSILSALFLWPDITLGQDRELRNSEPEAIVMTADRSYMEARLEEYGQVRIIVEISPAQARQLETELSRAQIQAQRAVIGRSLRRFSASVQEKAESRPGEPSLAKVHHHFETVPYVVMSVDAITLNELEQRDDVQRIQPDRLEKPQMNETTVLTGANEVWDTGYTGSGQSVVVIDTGTQLDHPNLAANIETDACFSSNVSEFEASSLCTDGAAEQTGGGSYDCTISGEFSPCRHGTHVSGTIAGTGAGFSGMAPDAGLIPVQVFSRFDDASICGGTTPCTLAFVSDQMKAYEYIYTTLRHEYDIAAINVSLGGGEYEQTCDYEQRKPLIDQLREVNIATIAASGNNGSTSFGIAPSCISSVVTVGSTTKSDGVSGFSNSTYYADILAPGSSIYSTIPQNSFATFQGTSMAAPHVSGAWALLREKFPDETTAQLLNRLQRTGMSVTDTRDGVNRTLARIQVDAALHDAPPPAAVVFEDNFENLSADGIPEGWVLDDSGNGQGWRFDNPGEQDLGLEGTFAIMDSDFYGPGQTQDAYLQSPPVRIGGISGPMLSFTHHLDTRASGFAELSISTDQGESFIPVFDSDDRAIVRGGTSNAPAGVRMFINLDYFIDGESDEVLIRWRYSGSWSYYWAINEVRVTGSGVPFSSFSSELSGDAPGWRFLSVPANGASYAELLGDVWTQGIPGAQNPEGPPNVLLYDEAVNSWIAPENLHYPAGLNTDSESENAGMGLMAFIFEQDDPESDVITWPKPVRASGYPVYDEVSRELTRTDYGDESGGWHLVGNPYAFPISWTAMVQDDMSGTLENIRPEIFIWDANINGGAGGYRISTGNPLSLNIGEPEHSGIIPPFQAFWVKVDEAAATGRITFRPGHEATGDGTLYRRAATPDRIAQNQQRNPEWFRTALRAEQSGERNEYAAVALLHFGKDEKTGLAAPVSLNAPALSLGLEAGRGQPSQLLQYLHMEPGEERIIPLAFDAVESGTYTLSLFDDDVLPQSIEVPEIYLTDRETNTEHLLYSPASGSLNAYTFNYRAEETTAARAAEPQTGDMHALSAPSVPVKATKDDTAKTAARFKLRLSTGTATSSEEHAEAGMPQNIALHQNYPNPFNPATTLSYSLPETTQVRLEVFNIAGQRVALLQDGPQAAGVHQVRFNASELSSGMYLYRLQAGNQTLSRRMTLIK